LDVTTENGNGGRRKAGAKRHLVIAAVCTAAVASMVGLSFAVVPLYRLCCHATGYAGTTQKAEQASDPVLDRTVTVHFGANVVPDLPWSFVPEQRQLKVKIGENTLAFYKATNHSDHTITGKAEFNVAPDVVAPYFDKLQCFCVNEQRLEPGQSVDLAVSFYIDPQFVKDDDTKNLSELTLSYTFHPVEEPEKKLGQAEAGTAGGG